MMELLLAGSALYRHLELVVNGMTKADMEILDTFNGACAAGKMIVKVRSRG